MTISMSVLLGQYRRSSCICIAGSDCLCRCGDKGSNGAPLLLVKDEEVYLTLGLIANYTDVQIQAFDSGDGKRVLIDDWGRNVARVKKNTSLRIKAGSRARS